MKKVKISSLSIINFGSLLIKLLTFIMSEKTTSNASLQFSRPFYVYVVSKMGCF
jgi:hypothetical protein